MADISVIKVGNADYTIKDTTARNSVATKINGKASGTTADHIVTWGADGYNVKDSGVSISSVLTAVPVATTSALGGIKISTHPSNPDLQSGWSVPVELDSSNVAKVKIEDHVLNGFKLDHATDSSYDEGSTPTSDPSVIALRSVRKSGTTTSYVKIAQVNISNASTSAAGLMSAADKTKLNGLNKGAANGVASLDSDGKVPSSELPSYVDDVLEYASLTNFPATGEAGKIYVALDTNKTYRWGGTSYVEISPSLALGETSSTAYRGDRGATAYSHATETKSGTQASGFYKIGVTAQGHVSGVSAVTKSDITGLGIPGADTHYTAKVILTNSSTKTTYYSPIAPGTDLYLNTIENGAVSSSIKINNNSKNQGIGITGIQTSQNDIVTLLPSILVERGLSIEAPSSSPTSTTLGAIGHSNSITAGSTTPGVNANGNLEIGGITYDSYGHVTSAYNGVFKIVKPDVTVNPTSLSTIVSATPGSLPTWSASVSGETLSFSFSRGTSPTFTTGNRLSAVDVTLGDLYFDYGT